MTPDDLAALAEELEPLVGARVQRVDVQDVGELIIELRVPGRTLRLLIVTRPDAARVHFVDARGPKLVEPGAFQGLLRKRLEGRPILGFGAQGRRFIVDVLGTRLGAELGQSARAFHLEDGPPPPERIEDLFVGAVPDHFPIAEALAARAAPRVATARREQLERLVLRPLEAERKRTHKLLANLEGDESKLRALATNGAHAELLKPMLGRIARGQRSVEATDWETGLPVTIALDPTLDARGNLEKLFARRKRGERGLAQVTARAVEALEQLEKLDAALARLRGASVEVLEAYAAGSRRPEDPAPRAGTGGAATERVAPIDRWSRRFESLHGAEIRVGRGARENDRLTFAAARGHDVWLHARGVPGAHVLLRTEKGQSPAEDALIDAAHLAVFHSQAKEATVAEVQYCEARYVRKMKGAAPGSVAVAREKVIVLRVEPDRLARLLGRRT